MRSVIAAFVVVNELNPGVSIISKNNCLTLLTSIDTPHKTPDTSQVFFGCHPSLPTVCSRPEEPEHVCSAKEKFN